MVVTLRLAEQPMGPCTQTTWCVIYHGITLLLVGGGGGGHTHTTTGEMVKTYKCRSLSGQRDAEK